MNKIEKKELNEYLHEARSWESSRNVALEKSRKLAWTIAGVSAAITAAAVIAVASLAPLKRTEPFLLRVNETTGAVDVVDVLTDRKSNYEEAVNRYFAQRYVTYREAYSRALAEDYYYSVGVMSSVNEQKKYFDDFNPKNPNSPLVLYGEYAKVKVDVHSISFIKPDIALVRYVKSIERGNEKPQQTHWVATIHFTYDKPRADLKERAVNPLGFQVLEYRKDPDSAAQLNAVATAPVAPAAPLASPPAAPLLMPPAEPAASAPSPSSSAGL